MNWVSFFPVIWRKTNFFLISRITATWINKLPLLVRINPGSVVQGEYLSRAFGRRSAFLTHVRAESPSSCACTACSSTPMPSAACLCGRPRATGRPSEPEPPGRPPAARPPPPGRSGGPHGSPRSQLKHTHTHTQNSFQSFRSNTSRLSCFVILFFPVLHFGVKSPAFR